MEKTNLLTLVVTLTVGIILAGSLLMPVISDATETERTFTNDGYFRMTELESDTNTTIEWDHTVPEVISVNDEDCDLSMLPIGKQVTIVGSDKMIIRYDHRDATNTVVQVFTAAGYFAVSVAGATDLSITLSGFDITATDGTNTRSVTATKGVYAEPTGDWIMKQSETAAYVHTSDSVIILAGITQMNTNIGVYATGTIEDGLDYTFVPTSGSPPTVTFGDTTFNYSEVANFNDLVTLTNCTFDITENDTSSEANYSYFLVPYKVTAERSQHLNDGEIALMNALPILVIIGLVLAAVGAIFIRNRD